MSNCPLIDIGRAIADADQALEDLASYVSALQAESNGQYPLPEDAAALLANAAAVREQLGWVLPPRLKADMAALEAEEMEAEDRWDASRL
jgi:hypothetical protein